MRLFKYETALTKAAAALSAFISTDDD